MIREILRTLGGACILAGTLLYFVQTDDDGKSSNETVSGLQAKVDTLQEKLNSTQIELSNLQTASSVDTKEDDKQVNPQKEEPVDVNEEPLENSTFVISPGTDSATVAQLLVEQGILNETAHFELYLEAKGLNGRIQIGEYDLDSTMSIERIAKIITTPN
ncbi:hypothetical protein ACXYMX_06180 [Sporosarcina sp. CAU 1771]